MALAEWERGGMVAVSNFSGFSNSAWALAKAPAILPIDGLCSTKRSNFLIAKYSQRALSIGEEFDLDDQKDPCRYHLVLDARGQLNEKFFFMTRRSKRAQPSPELAK